jgi:hypothetical protein
LWRVGWWNLFHGLRENFRIIVVLEEVLFMVKKVMMKVGMRRLRGRLGLLVD